MPKYSFSTRIFTFTIFLLSLFLSGCSGNNASHLPSIFELPGAVFGSVIENTTYNAKRRKVEAYVASHYLAIREDIKKGGGENLEGALDATGLKGEKRNKARDHFLSSEEHYYHHLGSVVDNLMHAFAALYEIKQEYKDINGIDYIEARNIIREYADDHFDALRIAIQKGEGEGLDQLASRLHIDEVDKLAKFKQKAKPLYKTIYLELLTVGFMIHK